MHMVFLLLFAFSFFNTSIGMSENQQRFCQVPTISQDEFNVQVYPISRPLRTEFEMAKKELIEQPESEVAKNRLKVLADQGYVPALYPLISNQLNLGNIPQALELSYQGACKSDPACALTLASIYAQTCDSEDEQYSSVRKQAVEQWLYNASVKRVLYDNNKQTTVSAYVHDVAKDYLHTFLQERQEEKEQLFNQYTSEQLNKYEKDILNGVSTDNALAAFLIKKRINDNSGESKKRAVAIAEKIINSPQFYPEQLHASGVRTALESLDSEQMPVKVKTRVSQLLSHWDLKEICTSELVETCQQESKPKLVTPQYCPEVLQELIAGADRNFEGTDLVDAAIYLNMHRKKDERIEQAVTTYLDRALQDSDPAVRRALIQQCQLDTEYLFSYYYRALNLYAKDLSSKNGLLANESCFMQEQLKLSMERADRGNDEEAIWVYHLLKNYTECFTAIPEKTRTALESKYFKRAFDAGNYTALCLGLPAGRNGLSSDENDVLNQTMSFWAKGITVASRQAPVEGLPEPSAIKKKAYDNIITLAGKKLSLPVKTRTIDDAIFYYQMFVGLMEHDPVRAIDAFHRAQLMIYCEDTVNDKNKINLFAKTGAHALCKRLQKEGCGSAYYVEAHNLFNQAFYLFKPESPDYFLKVIEQLEVVRLLLKQSLAAQKPHLNFSMFSESDIDAVVGTQYYHLGSHNVGSVRESYYKKAEEHLKKSAEQLNAKGMCEYAKLIFEGEGARGQQAFEQAIKYILKSYLLENEEAKEIVQSMLEKGIAFTKTCGGTMTASLLAEIKEFITATVRLSETDPVLSLARSTAHVSLDSEAQHAHYRMVKERADEGNSEAMAALAIMFRDGQGVTADQAQAQEYFIKSLITWDGNLPYPKLLNISFAALEDCARSNLRAQIGRAKAQVALSLPELKLIPSDQERNIKVIENRNTIIKTLKNVHAQMFASVDSKDRQLYFSSDLAHIINRNCTERTEGVFLTQLAHVYAQRMLRFPQEFAADAPEMKLMLQAFEHVQRRLEQSLSIDNATAIKKQTEAAQALKKLRDVLNDLMTNNNEYKNRFEYLGSLCDIFLAIKEERPAVQTMQTLKRLAARGNKNVMRTTGLLLIYGNKLNQKFPKERAEGIALLDRLTREQKDVRGFLDLAELSLTESMNRNKTSNKEAAKKIKDAEQLLAQVLEIDPHNSDAQFSLAEIYFYNPTLQPTALGLLGTQLTPEKREELIIKLLENVTPEQWKKANRACLLKNIMAMKNVQALEATLEQWEHLLLLSETDDDISNCILTNYREHNLPLIVNRWVQDATELLQKESVPDRAKISRVQQVASWIHCMIMRTLMCKMYVNSGELVPKERELCLKANGFAQELLEKATSYENPHPLAYGLKALIIMKDDIKKAKNHIFRAGLQLDKLKMKISDVPFLNNVFNTYLETVKLIDSSMYGKETEFISSLLKKYS